MHGWDIDFVSKRAVAKPGYLESINAIDTVPKVVVSSGRRLSIHHSTKYDPPALLPPNFDLAGVSIGSAALQTARDMFRETTILPTPMLTRKLKQRFYDVSQICGSSASTSKLRRFHAGGNVTTKWKGGTVSNAKKINEAYSEILTTVTSIKQIDQELQTVQQLLENNNNGNGRMKSASMGSLGSFTPLRSSALSAVSKTNRLSMLEASIDMEQQKIAPNNNAESLLLDHQIQRGALRSMLLPIDFPTAYHHHHHHHDDDNQLFALTAPRHVYAPNSSSLSSLRQQQRKPRNQHNSQLSSSSSTPSLKKFRKKILTKKSYHLTKELAITKSLLSHHLHTHLTSAHQGNQYRSRMWHILYCLSTQFSAMHHQYKIKKNATVIMANRHAQALRIQKSWSAYRYFIFRQKVKEKENSRLMICLGVMLRCRIRRKYAQRVRTFCSVYGSISRFGQAVRMYRFRICRVQKMYRAFCCNKDARVKVLKQRWDKVEQAASWKMAMDVKSIFYHLAASSKEEAEELLKRKKQVAKDLELYLSKQRPKLNEKLFRIGKPPREAQHKLRVYRKTMSEEEILKLEKIVDDYQDRYALNSVVKHYNSSLNKIGRLTDNLLKMEQNVLDEKQEQAMKKLDQERKRQVKQERKQHQQQQEKQSEENWQEGTDKKTSSPLRTHMAKTWKDANIDQRALNQTKKQHSSKEKNKKILKNIVAWKKKEHAIKLTDSTRNRLARIEKKREEQLREASIEPTSNYGIRKVPTWVQTIALKYAIERIRQIHHHHHEKEKKKLNAAPRFVDLDGFDFDFDKKKKEEKEEEDGYRTYKNQKDKEQDSNGGRKAGLFNIDDLKHTLKDESDAIDEAMQKKLEKDWKNNVIQKFPLFLLFGNLTEERMQCLMVVAGVTAASCSLLSMAGSKRKDVVVTKDLRVRVRKKLKSMLSLSKKTNFFNQLHFFRTANVKKWAVAATTMGSV